MGTTTERQARAGHTLTITRTFRAPRELVFRCWTEQEHLARWLRPREFRVLFAQGDVRVGGAWRSGMRSDAHGEHVARGVYREITAPSRLVFTHRWEREDGEPGPETLVEITFAEREGATVMTFVQSGFGDEATRDSHAEGWSEAFDNLAGRLYDEGAPDGMLTLTRSFKAPRELVFKAFTDPAHIRRWWGPHGYTTPHCEADLRVGGEWKYCMRSADGQDAWCRGVYMEIDPPRRLVTTDRFCDAAGNPTPPSSHGLPEGFPDEMRLETTFEESHGITTVTIVHAIPRAFVAQSGAAQGWTESLEKLERMLAAPGAGERDFVLSRWFDARRERVFAAWTDAAHISEWWGPEGFRTTTDHMDLRPGGEWRFVMHGPDGRDYVNRVVYHEVEPPSRLVYEHGGDDTVEPVRFHVTVSFDEVAAPDGRVGTRVTLLSSFGTAAERERVEREHGAEEGGRQTLARLAALLAKGA